MRYLDAGVRRVILGTAAAQAAFAFVAEMVAKYGSAIAVGVDLRDGMVAVKGWTETSGANWHWTSARALQDVGVRTVICTDIARDGAMAGANRALYSRADGKQFGMRFIASGGVNSLEDIRALKALGLLWRDRSARRITPGSIPLADAILEANA